MSELRIICMGGTISDIGWLASHGVDEAGVVTYDTSTIPDPSFIHNAGITTATWNPFNTEGNSALTPGDQFGGVIAAAKNLGWDLIAGAGLSGDITRVLNNYMWVCNYAGIGGDDYDGVGNGQINAYAAPWSHPIDGKHVDYIQTCVNGCDPTPASTINQMINAYNAGAQEVGILINMTSCMNLGLAWYINLIDTARSQGVPCDNVLYYCGVGYDICSLVQNDFGITFRGLIDHYGVRYGMRGT